MANIGIRRGNKLKNLGIFLSVFLQQNGDHGDKPKEEIYPKADYEQTRKGRSLGNKIMRV
jgi:hypothetical protein